MTQTDRRADGQTGSPLGQRAGGVQFEEPTGAGEVRVTSAGSRVRLGIFKAAVGVPRPLLVHAALELDQAEEVHRRLGEEIGRLRRGLDGAK